MFNWFDRLLVKVAKKILNRYAPKGEFIAYINKQEEKILKKLGGYGKPVNETGIKSFWPKISDFNPFSAAKDFVVKTIVEKLPFLRNINPWVALGVFAIGWLYFSSRKPESPDFGDSDFNNFEKGILLNHQSNDMSIPVVYGERKVGGTRCFVETSGTDNEFLYIALVLCEGEIESVDKIFIDDKEVTWSGTLADDTLRTVGSSDGNFYKDSTSLISVKCHFGTDSQAQCDLLGTLTSWTSNHRLRGLAYISLKIKWHQDAFGGLPTIHALIKGKKVVAYNSSSVAQTAAHSNNPAWCLLDYLTNERYGKGLAIANIDIPSFYTASGVLDTDVTAYGSTTIDVLDCNAVIDTSKKVLDNVRELTKGARSFLPFSAGKYKMIVETTGSASITLTEDDIIGGYSLASESKSNKFNRVIVSFINPARNYQVDEVQFPEIDDSAYTSADQHATMKTADGGFLLEGRFDFTTITSPYQALELAEVILRRSRDSKGLQLNVGFNAYDLVIGDIVNITLSSLGYDAKPHRVIGITFNEDFTIDLNLVIHQDAHYTWATKTQVAATPSTTLPNPYSVTAPASVTLSDTLVEYNDGTVIVALDVTIGASTDKFVDYYQVEYKLSTDSDYIIYAQGSGLNHRVLNVIDQKIYNVRVKAVNALGVSSTYTSATRTIIGAIEPPSDVSDFACNILGQEAHLSWTQIADLDLAYYQIRYSSVTDGTGDWANSVSLVEKVSRPATSINVPARVGTYLIKAVDKLGNFSSNATGIISNVTSIQNFNAVTSVSEHPTFGGTLTNTAIVDDTLRLDSSELFDAASGNFDAETTRFFDSGVANADFYASGNYLFTNVVDIGARHTCRLTASLKQTSSDPDDLFDNRTGNFDSASGAFDGDTPSNSHAHIEIATSDDNSTYTDFQNFVIGNYTARYFKFRVVLTSSDLASTPVVEEVSVTIDMEDRIFSGNDITSGAGAKTVTFTSPYKTANYAVGITGQGMATGDFFLVDTKTINGFNVTFKNSSGSAVSKVFDFIAKGY